MPEGKDIFTAIEMFVYFHSAWSGVIIIVVLTLFIAFLLIRKLRRFTSFNPEPDLRLYRPRREDGSQPIPTPVQIGLFVNKFLVFEPLRGEFVLDGYLWMVFDPALFALSTISQFSFERGELLEKSEPETILLESGKLFAKFKIRLKFLPDLNFLSFPLDDHRIFVILNAAGISTDEALFISTYTGVRSEPGLVPSGWRIINHLTRYGYQQVSFREKGTERSYPRVIFAFDIAKAGLRKAAVVVLPIIAIFYVAFFTLLIVEGPGLGPSVLLSAGAVSALLAYRFVLETMSPSVSYLTLADYIYGIFLFASFVVFMVSVYAIATPPAILATKVIAFFTVPLVIMVALYLLYRRIVVSGR